jgi:hypothetical protein
MTRKKSPAERELNRGAVSARLGWGARKGALKNECHVIAARRGQGTYLGFSLRTKSRSMRLTETWAAQPQDTVGRPGLGGDPGHPERGGLP